MSITVFDSEVPPSAAVTTAAWPDVTALAVAVNVDEVAPAGTLSEAGTGSAGLLEVRVTEAPPEGAGPLRITLHVVEPADAKLDGLHATEFGITGGAAGAGGAKVIMAFCEPPLSVAVIVPLWLALTLAALAVNEVEVAPAATVTDDGAVSAELLLLSATAAPPLGAAPLSETEHVEVVGVTNEVGLQENRFTVTGVKTEMVPPLPVAVIATPLDDEATVFVNPRFTVPLVAETVTLMAANTPSGIAVWLMPEAIQS